MPYAFLVFMLWFAPLKTYYLSANGNDNNDGSTPQTAWKTIAKLNTIDFEPGDKLYLEANQSFEGHLQLTQEDGGIAQNPVEINSFGVGKATIICKDTSAITIKNMGGVVVKNLILKGNNRTQKKGSGLVFLNTLPGGYRPKANSTSLKSGVRIQVNLHTMRDFCGKPVPNNWVGAIGK